MRYHLGKDLEGRECYVNLSVCVVCGEIETCRTGGISHGYPHEARHVVFHGTIFTAADETLHEGRETYPGSGEKIIEIRSGPEESGYRSAPRRWRVVTLMTFKQALNDYRKSLAYPEDD